MMTTGKAYHLATSYHRYRMTGHYLDWANQPRIHKIYPQTDIIQLPEVSSVQKAPLWRFYTHDREVVQETRIDLNLLSRLLMLTYCFTAKSRHGGNDFYYRSAASAGALYPCELYLVADPLDGLKAGVYHYGLHNRSLTPLRYGRFTTSGGNCFPGESMASVSLYFFITAIFFRSAWKYRERAFRYVLMDAGHLMENLVLALKSTGLTYSIHYDYNDLACERLLGIDGKREGVLACIAIHHKPQPAADQSLAIDPLSKTLIEASTVSENEICYDEIESFYRSSGKLPDADVETIHLMESIGKSPDPWIDIDSPDPSSEEIPYPDAVFLRRSRRNYVDTPLPRASFMRLMATLSHAATQDLSPGHRYASALVTGFIAGNIEGIAPGFYLLDPARRRFGCVFEGYFTSKMASACLDQEWLRNAAIHLLFLTDLAQIDRTWGPRSYRYAMLAAGRIGQAIYIAATALGLGACGIGALYDGEARELLGLSEDAALLYLVAAGPVKKVV